MHIYIYIFFVFLCVYVCVWMCGSLTIFSHKLNGIILQHTTAHHNTLQYTATHYITLQQHTQCNAMCRRVLQCVAQCCNTLQHPASNCSTQQQTATHDNNTHTRLLEHILYQMSRLKRGPHLPCREGTWNPISPQQHQCHTTMFDILLLLCYIVCVSVRV